MKCGLLGRKLAHSYSPVIHKMLGTYSYELFEKEPEELAAFLCDGDWDGINVTVPYKKAVLPYLDELTPIAQRLGAVNTIVKRDSRLIGHNTDYYGFQMLLETLNIPYELKEVLVLGSGGASNTAVAALQDRGARVTVISRTGENNYENLHLYKDAHLIVNTTPVGMYPNTGAAPVDTEKFPNLQGVVDVIYNPARTELLIDAEKRGLEAANGLLMLVAQAKEAAEWFTGSKIDDSCIKQIHDELSWQMLNIVLIGMPGCGKSTVGHLLAQQMGRTYVDSDAMVAELAGMPIPEIFDMYGESRFRDLETEALTHIGKQSGLVIATGGGCVTKEANYPILYQNGTVIWLERNISNLPIDGRPLSHRIPLEEMYRQRLPMYQAFADLCIENNGTPNDTVIKILEALK